MARGKFIVFDGTDGSGKSTQSRLLAARLRRAGKRVAIVDFPQYRTTFFGKFLRRLLDGEFGPMGKLNPYLTSLAYAGDRWQAKTKIEALLKKGMIVLADRYTSANMIHQGAKFSSATQRTVFLRWLKKLEFSVYRIPRPDLVLFFDVPPAVSRQMVAGRRHRLDTAERDRKHQLAAYRQAVRLVGSEPRWLRVPGAARGRMVPRRQVADQLWRQLHRVFSASKKSGT